MAHITDTDAPPDVPKAPNDLDNIVDPDAPELNDDGTSIDRYLAFGTTPRAIHNPPRDGEIVTYKVKVECIGQAHKRRTDGEVRYRSDLEILSVARLDEELPPDFKSKKQEEAEAKAAAKAAAKGQGLYPEPELPYDGDQPEPDVDTEPSEGA